MGNPVLLLRHLIIAFLFIARGFGTSICCGLCTNTGEGVVWRKQRGEKGYNELKGPPR